MSAVNDPNPAAPQQSTAPGSDAIQTGTVAPPTGIQTAPAPDAPPVPLPARPKQHPITPEELGRAMTRLDRMLVVLVVILMGLLATFSISNSDFWLHLAAGRDWLHDNLALGADPYSYTGSGHWVNHSWLYSVIVYGLYTLGGPVVILTKTALLMVLAVLMLSIRRRGMSLWLPGVCTALAIVTMSPRFLMQPSIFSYVLLGVTLVILLRREWAEEPAGERKRRVYAPVPWLGEASDRSLWLLPPLFALWVNLDAWFFVGPFAVALYLAGSLLHAFLKLNTPEAPRPGSWRPLVSVLVVGVAACLLNPFGYHALVLPGELSSPALAHVRDDPMFARLLCSPLDFAQYLRTDTGLNIAGIAYYPLVVLGLLSFVALSSAEWRWSRAVLFFGFLVLSLFHIRAIPFFAIVGGPIAALNFQDYAADRFGTTPIAVGWWKEWSLLGRGLSVLGAFVLAAMAWPGWLFGFPAEGRRVGLEAAPAPELVKLAKQLDAWHKEGKLKDHDRVLNLQPQVANALAFLCEERIPFFFDYRFENYSPDVADDYVALRKLFVPEGPGDRPLAADTAVWKPILERRNITFLVVSDVPARLRVHRMRTAQASPLLVRLYMDGNAAVYAPRQKPIEPQTNEVLDWARKKKVLLDGNSWMVQGFISRDKSAKALNSALGKSQEVDLEHLLPAKLPPPLGDTGRFKGMEFDPWEYAFGPKAEALPATAPKRPQPLAWWMRFAYGPGPRPPEAADAGAYVDYMEETAFAWNYQHVWYPEMVRTFPAIPATIAARSCNPMADVMSIGYMLQELLERGGPPLRFDDFGPVYLGQTSPIFLAIRSARRALLHNPDDADAYFQLGRAYLALFRQTDEAQMSRGGDLYRRLRQAQMIAAMRSAVVLDPDNPLAQMYLAMLYNGAGAKDLQFKHLGEAIQAAKRDPKRIVADQLKDWERTYSAMEKEIKDRQNLYAVQSEKKAVIEKADAAQRLGLAEKALQVLMESDVVEFGKQGTKLELELLLRLGRLEELRVQLWPENDPQAREQLASGINSSLGEGEYEKYRFLLAAAEGNYAEADEFVAKAAASMEDAPLRRTIRRRLELESPFAKEPGAAKNLSAEALLAVGYTRMIASEVPAPGPVGGILGNRVYRLIEREKVKSVISPLYLKSEYETLRGLLKLETGDIPGARQHLHQALYANKTFPDKGPGIRDIIYPFNSWPLAFRYLQMIDKKE